MNEPTFLIGVSGHSAWKYLEEYLAQSMHWTNSTVYGHQCWHESSATSLQPNPSATVLRNGFIRTQPRSCTSVLPMAALHYNGRVGKVPQGPCGTQSPTCLPWDPSQKKFTNLWFSTIKIYWTPIVYQTMKSLFCWKISASHKYLINPCDSPYIHLPPAPHL